MNKEEIFKILKESKPNIPWLAKNTIFMTIAGSRSHGMAKPDSDYDVRGCCIAPQQYYTGFVEKFEQAELKDPYPDTCIFELTKFFKLASASNANVIELLFTDPKFFLHVDDLGKQLIDIRHKFLSKHVRQTYVKYARSQAHRISGHKRWLDHPQETMPTRESCGLPEKPLIAKNQYDAVKSMIQKKIESWNTDFQPFNDSQKIYLQSKIADILTEMDITRDQKWEAAARCIGLHDNLILVMKKEKEYENKVEDYKAYQRWKKERNPKRAELEAKHKFDTKHGAALIRIMRSGKECLKTYDMQVERIYDCEELMEIKNGLWSYEKLIEEADKLEAEVEEAYKNSKLPNQPNIELLDNLCMELIEQSLDKFSWYNMKKWFKK